MVGVSEPRGLGQRPLDLVDRDGRDLVVAGRASGRAVNPAPRHRQETRQAQRSTHRRRDRHGQSGRLEELETDVERAFEAGAIDDVEPARRGEAVAQTGWRTGPW